MTLKINSKAPRFVIPSTSKDKYSLKDSIGKSNLQLEFLISSTNSYPRKQVKSIGGLKP